MFPSIKNFMMCAYFLVASTTVLSSASVGENDTHFYNLLAKLNGSELLSSLKKPFELFLSSKLTTQSESENRFKSN